MRAPSPPPRASGRRTVEVLPAEASSTAPGAAAIGPVEGAEGLILSEIEVVWRVTRRSLGAHAPEGSSRLVELIVRLEGLGSGTTTGSASVVDGAVSRVVETFDRVLAEVIPDIRGETHVECPGVLHATVARGEGSWRLVYARSPLVAALGVAGGRAEVVRVRVV